MKKTQHSYFPILFLLICGVLSWNYVSNTDSTTEGSLNFNQNDVKKTERSISGSTHYDQNTVTKTWRRSGGSTHYDQNTVTKTGRRSGGSTHYDQNTVTKTGRRSSGSTNYDQNTVTNTERSSGGSTNYDQNTVPNTERSSGGSTNYDQNTVTKTWRRSGGSTNYDQNTVTKTGRSSSGSTNYDQNTVTKTGGRSGGSTNYDQNTVTKTGWSSGGSTNYDQNNVKNTESITSVSQNTKKNTYKEKERNLYSSVDLNRNTATYTESIANSSTNNNNNTNIKTERTPRDSIYLIQNTATQTKRFLYGSTNSDKNTDTQTERTLRDSVYLIQNTAAQTERLLYGSTNSDNNTDTQTERAPRRSVNSNQHTATQTEMMSAGSVIYTQHRKRYQPDLFTASWTTFNGGQLSGLNKSTRNTPSEIKNTEINETLNLLRGLSTQSTEHLTTLQALQRDPCQKYGTCSVAQNKTKWFCYCDSDCEMFNDCCSDYNRTVKDSNSQLSFECYSQDYVLNYDGRNGFLAVGSCPNSYKNRTVKDRCSQNNFTENGIFVSNGKNLVFKNKFCALCNNVTDVQEFDIAFALDADLYEYMFKMKKENRKTYFLSNSDFKIIPPVNTNLRFCVKYLISTSTNNGCQSYNNPILVYPFKLYKNYYCLDSNVSNDLNLFLCMYIISDVFIQESLLFSLSILVSLGNPAGDYTDENQCREWTEEIKQHGICSQYDIFINASIDFKFSLISNQMLRKEIFHQIVLMVGNSYNTKNFTIRTSKFKIWIDENGLIATILVEMILQKSAFHHEIEDIRNHLSKRKVRVILNNGSRDQDIEIFNTYDLPGNVTNTSSISQLESKTHYFKLESLKTFPSENGIVGRNQIDDWRCDEVYIKVLFVGEELHVQQMSCLTIFSLKTHRIAENFISVIITYVSFSVSFIALCVLVIVNRQLNLITSIPISNIENISVSIMLSNILFMVGIWASEKKAATCYVIGVILHYLILCVFSFMTISVACITSTLSKMTVKRTKSRESSRKRKRLTAIGLITPLFLVIPSICIDAYGPSFLSAGYGSNACFPNNYPANLIFFTAPVMLSVFVNSSCLVFVIIQVCKIRTEAANIRKLNIYQDAKMYLRMVALSGVFWILGIFNALYNSEWLEYIFTLLCGLTGFFLAVANLTTNRVKCTKKTDYSST